MFRKIQAFPRRLFPKAHSNIWNFLSKNLKSHTKKRQPIAARRVWSRQPLSCTTAAFFTVRKSSSSDPDALLQPLSLSLSLSDSFALNFWVNSVRSGSLTRLPSRFLVSLFFPASPSARFLVIGFPRRLHLLGFLFPADSPSGFSFLRRLFLGVEVFELLWGVFLGNPLGFWNWSLEFLGLRSSGVCFSLLVCRFWFVGFCSCRVLCLKLGRNCRICVSRGGNWVSCYWFGIRVSVLNCINLIRCNCSWCFWCWRRWFWGPTVSETSYWAGIWVLVLLGCLEILMGFCDFSKVCETVSVLKLRFQRWSERCFILNSYWPRKGRLGQYG